MPVLWQKNGDGRLFLECTFPPLLHVRELPEFSPLMALDKSKWSRCILWHGWLPGLSCSGDRAPWAASFGQLACLQRESCLGAYPLDSSGYWAPPDYWDADDMALNMSYNANIWTDGSREDFSSVGGFEVAGAGVYLLAAEVAYESAVGRVAEEYRNARLERCRAFMPVPGVLQSVQRAEFWGAILALQAYWPCHVGTDNLNVARSIGRLLDRGSVAKPLPLVKDGDLVALVQYMIRTRGRDRVSVTKVKGHASDADVAQGRVRIEDKLGNAEADAGADIGRRHQTELLVDARRVLLDARNSWYFIMLQLHRFMIAVSRVAVNHDGKGVLAPDPLVWDQGSKKKLLWTDIMVNLNLASLPGPPGFLNGPWVLMLLPGHTVLGSCAAFMDIRTSQAIGRSRRHHTCSSHSCLTDLNLLFCGKPSEVVPRFHLVAEQPGY